MEKFFATSPPGLESVLAGELTELGLLPPRRYFKTTDRLGGLEFQGELASGFEAAYRLRAAERVFLRLGTFPAASFAELEAGAARLPWRKFIAANRPTRVKAECRASKLHHDREVAQRLAQAAGLSDCGDDDSALVVARLEKDACTVDLDLSGQPLHRRGYRLATAKAPLRETLAAALLRASEWDATSPLIDPFCGSGTIAIEAALLAAGIPSGSRRSFAFADWPCFKDARWTPGAAKRRGVPLIAGSDRDAGAIEAARANAERAGVAHLIEFRQAAVSAAEPPPGQGWVVTNPPYGLRVDGQRDIRDLYAQFGKFFRARCPGWRAAMVCPSVQLARASGLAFTEGLSTKNGGLDVRFARL